MNVYVDSNEVEIQRWRQLLLKLESLPVTEFDFERESKEWALLLEVGLKEFYKDFILVFDLV